VAPLPALGCACASLRRAARAVTALYDEALRPHGLRSTQFTLLQVLSKRGEMTQGQLGEMLALDSTTLTRSLRPLVVEESIEGHRGEDRREVVLRITPDGQDWLEDARPAWERAQERLRARLSKAQWSQLVDDLADVAAAAKR
jgi:DNA-binding MarR family transcriptional regulator